MRSGISTGPTRLPGTRTPAIPAPTTRLTRPLIDKGTTTVDVNVPSMGMITVNNGGKILGKITLNNANTVTVNSGGQVEFKANYPAAQKYYWNMILNDGALWYGNLHKDGGMYGNFTVGDSATVTIRHSGALYNNGNLNGTISGPAPRRSTSRRPATSTTWWSAGPIRACCATSTSSAR